MLNVVLYQPEIPPNTGNIIRLCANSNAALHLIHPLGFTPDEKRVRRAGLDYHQFTSIAQHTNFEQFLQTEQPKRIFACSTKSSVNYSSVEYQDGDYLLFGPESRGLPADILQSLGKENIIRIPMIPESRSINLSNAVAIILFEAWRQLDFMGGE